MIYQRSSALFKEALKYIPGGVNSPVRAFKAVGGTPIFIKEAKGAYLIDEDDNKYIEYINSWGPMILGHSYPKVVDAIIKKAKKGTSFGAPTEIENNIAERAKKIAEKVSNAFEHVGLLAVELFQTEEGEILVNEVAPRPHNSGHFSIEGSLTNQFEQHIRAILNLPLGNTKSKIVLYPIGGLCGVVCNIGLRL